MKINEGKIRIMRDDKISKALLKLSLPAIAGMLVNALYNVVDAYFVGGLGTSQIAAVSVIFPIVQVVIGVGLTFGCGAAMSISRRLGSNELEKANTIASTALFLSIAIGVILTLSSVIFIDKILISLGATETILPYARSYGIIYLSGCVLHIFCITMNNIVLSEGAAKMTMFAMILGGGLNVILDPIFIYTFGLGVSGAAIATVTAQGVTFLIYIWYMSSARGVLKFRYSLLRFEKKVILEIIKFGVPVLVLQVLSGFAIGLTNTAASQYGDSAVAAMGIVVRILALASYVVFGYVKGFQPIAGYNYGAKNYQRLNKAISLSLIWVISYSLFVTAVLIIFPVNIMHLFSVNDQELISLGVRTLQANAVVFMLFGIVMVYSTLYLSLGKAKEGSILSFARQGIFFIPAILIMPHAFGLNGIIYAQPLADLLAFSITIIYALQLHRKLKVVIER